MTDRPSRLVLVLRRLLICTFGHRPMFVHRDDGVHLLCPRCLTSRPVTALPARKVPRHV
jgi:hypothetical protein